ncbi:uncharacterized protein LOC121297487 [Polyodon spathula]|uniref:uncharacterized protein LOC121297487 n=1 Tax=Polyodon spathula TaxID=7913 RepID=UPI001B7DB78B|nr:uncharacterized protein LOC121297487 [Polyodon spathula]
MSTEANKPYDPPDTAPKFVKRKDDGTGRYNIYECFICCLFVAGDDDPDTLRAEMSCGHAVDPISLTLWCRSLLDQGQYTCMCPALKDGSTKSCEKLWPYQEVRRLAVLTDEEQQNFEEKVASLAAAKYCEFKTCPGCKTYVERRDLGNLNVHCTICTAKKAKAYEFCWQCMNEWKGLGPRSDRCANEQLQALENCPLISLPGTNIKNCPLISLPGTNIKNCPLISLPGTNIKNCPLISLPGTNIKNCPLISLPGTNIKNCPLISLPGTNIKNCPLISLPGTNIKNCPSMRACPTCGSVVEHKLTGCKNIICNQYKVEFCFACLELTPVCQAARQSSWFSVCAKDIAPRQTSIPVWNRAN